ncbi:CD151 antigen-like [Etheostoma cragini]|uniref:CD151 antigen-like n=1 Tax=Etheostoma cragini TaxID=417921 RepID=UPI00155DFC09|nr:CD151 antigen-like [Etheostoma cragini]
MGVYEEKKETCGTICLKYLLFSFNFLFWVSFHSGVVNPAQGIQVAAYGSQQGQTLTTGSERHPSLYPDVISYHSQEPPLLLEGGTAAQHACYHDDGSSEDQYVGGGSVGLGREKADVVALLNQGPNTHRHHNAACHLGEEHMIRYFVLLLCIFLLEILAGVLAYIYYQQLNEELKQNLRETMTQKYQQSSHEHITRAVDKLQEEFKCCGSNSSSDWEASVWIRSIYAKGRKVPDSCCKSPTELCGLRDHPSNIYKVEGGCITKLEKFIQDHLKIIGAVGVGIACVQVIGMVFTCCLYRSLKAEPY